MSSADPERYPATPLQQVMVLDSLREPGTGVNIQQVVFDLRRPIDPERFRTAWNVVLERHDALRARFHIAHTDPAVTVDFPAPTQVPIQYFEWLGTSPERRQALFESFLEADRTSDFDLNAPPLLRATLLQFEPAHHRVVCTFHHAILDGRSYAELIDDLMDCYEAEEERPPRAGAPPYESFLSWLAGRDPELSRTHWVRELDGYEGAELLSHLAPVQSVTDRGHETVERTLPGEVADAVRRFADEHEVTPNSVMQGTWAILMSRIADVEDIVVGNIVAGRKGHVEGADDTLGMFINTLPMRAATGGPEPVRDLFRDLVQRQRSHREHSHVAARQIQSWIGLPPTTALFDTVLVFEQKLVEDRLARLDGRWRGRRYLERHIQTGLPVNLAAYLGQELRLAVEFDRAKVDREAGAALLPRFESLLRRILEDGLRPLAELDLLDEPERTLVLETWQGEERPLPFRAVHLEVAARAAELPDRVAVRHRGAELRYGELESRANQLAARLRESGVRAGTRVAVALPRSLDTIVSFLGILKAGASYVPLDAMQPEERLRFLLEDASPILLIADETTLQTLSDLEAVRRGKLACLTLDEASAIGPAAESFEPVAPAADDEAYLLYTSGSTGQPKGARIGHGGLANHCAAIRGALGIGPEDRVPQFAPTHVDFAAEEIYPTLTAGGTLVLRDDDLPLTEFLPRAAQDEITILNLPTAFWHEMVRAHDAAARPWPASVRTVVVGGEKASAELLAQWQGQLDHPIEWWNTYGPTEATITSTAFHLRGPLAQGEEIPIGRPIANVTHYVLDRGMRPVPIGAVGELYIGGPGVALGYAMRPELEEERFPPDPFRPGEGRRLYATGDLVRYREDGELLYVGRRDHQIKLRGFRIELGEVDAVLERHPEVKRAATIFDESAGANGRLVSFVEAEPGAYPGADAVREHAASHLAEASVPSCIVFRPRLPLLATGKIARSELRLAPQELRRESEISLRPRTPEEQRLQAIWCEVLGRDEVGIRDDFRDLGGDSLLVVRMLLQVEQAFGHLPDANEFFRRPTIEAMAREIADAEATPRVSLSETRAALVPLQPAGEKPPIFCLRGANQYEPLADALGPDQPVYGIFLPEIESRLQSEGSEAPTVEEIARASLRAIEEHHPGQPFALAGFSFGGTLAYEMAQQMRDDGREPLGLFLFDTILPGGVLFDRRRWLAEHLRRLARGRLPQPVRQWLDLQLGRELATRPNGGDESVVRTIQNTLTEIADDYRTRMRPYAGPITLLRANRHDLRAGRVVSHANGWEAWARGELDVVAVEGMHLEILRAPGVTTIADAIARRLA